AQDLPRATSLASLKEGQGFLGSAWLRQETLRQRAALRRGAGMSPQTLAERPFIPHLRPSIARKRIMARKSTKRPVKKTKGPKAKKPITLYYWSTPNGHKISIMLEELGVPYEARPVNINKGEQFAPAFLKISPNNRIPAIVDSDGPGGRPISVFESGAILQYLGRKFGRFYPKDERARVQVEEWLFWQMGGLGPMTGQANHFVN